MSSLRIYQIEYFLDTWVNCTGGWGQITQIKWLFSYIYIHSKSKKVCGFCLSAEFVLQLLQLLECMVGSDNLFAKEGVFKHPIMDKFQLGEDQSWSK